MPKPFTIDAVLSMDLRRCRESVVSRILNMCAFLRLFHDIQDDGELGWDSIYYMSEEYGRDVPQT